eukprot:gene3319-6572_t
MTSFSTSSYNLTSKDVASAPPALTAPIGVSFSPNGSHLTYLYPDTTGSRQVYTINVSKSGESSKAFDANASGELSLEEQLRRERMRLFALGVTSYEWIERKSDKKQLMLIPLNGQILISEFSEETERSLVTVYDGSSGSAIDPHWSPDGTKIAFVILRDVYVIEVDLNYSICSKSNIPKRITFAGSTEGISCGLADYVAQEEMDRYRGFWWSPDSNHILYTGAKNPLVQLAVASTYLDISFQEPSSSTTKKKRRKMACADNNSSIDGVGDKEDLDEEEEIEDRRQRRLQLLRIDPLSGESILVVEEKTDVWINLHDMCHMMSMEWRPKSLIATLGAVHDEDFFFIWASERSGFCQLYLYQYDSVKKCGRVIGGALGGDDGVNGDGGSWVVDSIDAVDEESGLVYFHSSEKHCSEKHLGSMVGGGAGVGGRGGKRIRLTGEVGWHSCTVCVASKLIVDLFSSISQPPVMRLHYLSNHIVTAFNTAIPETAASLSSFSSKPPHIYTQSQPVSGSESGCETVLECVFIREVTNGSDWNRNPMVIPSLTLPVFETIPSSNSNNTTTNSNTNNNNNNNNNTSTPLQCCLYIPDVNVFGPGPYPTVVAVYGGPHVQRVTNTWGTRVDLRSQRMAQNGILVIKCDNRGSSRRGLAFEGVIQGDMGNVEVQDQSAAVEYYTTHSIGDCSNGIGGSGNGIGVSGNGIGGGGGLVDRSRVGVIGWSYGGYLSAMSICRAPDTFCCAIAGAPVTHWDGYDTHYTERYMGLPAENELGYMVSSVMSHVGNMGSNQLMLIHGLIDENVHFRHTARLINSLIQHGKQYELVLFPCERHAPHGLLDRVYLEDRINSFFEKQLNMLHLTQRRNDDATTTTTTTRYYSSAMAVSTDRNRFVSGSTGSSISGSGVGVNSKTGSVEKKISAHL